MSVDAVRTGCGKSQTARKLTDLLIDRGHDPVVVREPIPYGDLAVQRVQHFASMVDGDAVDVTLEEREEYDAHVEVGHVVSAGVDYEAILVEAEVEADGIVWEGGNHEHPCFRLDVHIVLADPTKRGAEGSDHPARRTSGWRTTCSL